MGIRKVRMAKHTGKHTAKRSKAAGVAAFLVLMFSGFLLATNLLAHRFLINNQTRQPVIWLRIFQIHWIHGYW